MRALYIAEDTVSGASSGRAVDGVSGVNIPEAVGTPGQSWDSPPKKALSGQRCHIKADHQLLSC